MSLGTYEAISTVTLSSNVSVMTIANLPQNYTDIVIVIDGTFSGSYIRAGFNNASTTSYNALINNPGSAPYTPSQFWGSGGFTGLVNASTQSQIFVNLLNYSNNLTNKSFIIEARGGRNTFYWGTCVGTTQSINAIDSFTFNPDSGEILAGTVVSVYGLTASNLKAEGGNLITTDGTYWYHAFTSSGTFVPRTGVTLSCDVLVVAGGGGGGAFESGGGGAGGVIGFASQSISSTQTVTVGAGGSGGNGSNMNGFSASNSQFGSLTAAVRGGGGGSRGGQGGGYAGGTGNGNPTGGDSGGSGGGASLTGGAASGTGTAGQGNNGGVGGALAGGQGGGGGGGAGAAGNAGWSTGNGNGGAGTSSVTNWGSLSNALTALNLGVAGVIAGGGGGTVNNTGSGGTFGLGGSGGGGQASVAGYGANGRANTGSGGGGGGGTGAGTGGGGAGGSGLVIVRYAV